MRVYGMVRSVAIGSMVLLALMCVEAHAQRKNSGTAELSGVIKAGQTKVNSNDGLTYVWIPPGTFMMGCSPLYSQCFGDEKPHSVTITKGFWMGQTPVTQAAYQRVKGYNPSSFRGDQRPVERVTWFAATDYCSAVGLRLPTEAEWEYAARAGSTALTYGDIDSIAWYAGNSGHQTHDVAQKQPNAWKLYDMLGNVEQWTADWYDQNYYNQSPSQDPHGPISGTRRVLRGTSWYIDGGVRVPGRASVAPGSRYGFFGFRCAGEYDSATPTFSPTPTAVATAAFSPGQMKVNSRDGLTYVWIPAGTFMMGCSPGDVECRQEEWPSNAVTITKGFWLGQTPVTQAAYQRVKGANPSYYKGDQRPVETVSWDDAASYCSVVGMRLPSEAEWEYAARAGSTASRYGDIDLIAWYGDHIGNQTHDVAQKQPNAWKLYDMLGNVEQWTADWYDQNYYKESPSQDPHGPSSGQYRVLRGGGSFEVSEFIRVSYRGSDGPSDRRDKIGFRCAGEVLPGVTFRGNIGSPSSLPVRL